MIINVKVILRKDEKTFETVILSPASLILSMLMFLIYHVSGNNICFALSWLLILYCLASGCSGITEEKCEKFPLSFEVIKNFAATRVLTAMTSNVLWFSNNRELKLITISPLQFAFS